MRIDSSLATAPPARGAAPARRIALAAALGNGLVVYDLTAYSFSAVVIGKLFFPSSTPLASLLLVFATFGASFLMRSLGAIVIGNLADRRGRGAGLTVSIALMTLGTVIIAVAPSCASIGVAATWLMVLARLLQGFAAGGEIGAASALLMELAGPGRRCYLSSWRAASQGAAALAGALVTALATALLSPAELQAWGWRIPFALGTLIGPVGWYLRRHMPAPRSAARPPAPGRIFARYPRSLCLGILLMAAPSASMYIMVFYMPSYLVSTAHMAPVLSLLASCLAAVVILVGSPLMARLADRQARRKPIQRLALLGGIALVLPVFLALRQVGEAGALLLICAYVAVALTNGGASSVMLLEAYPPHYRAAGMSITYSVGTLFGGFSPFAVTWLIERTGDPMAPAWYLMAALGISWFALAAFPEAPAQSAPR